MPTQSTFTPVDPVVLEPVDAAAAFESEQSTRLDFTSDLAADPIRGPLRLAVAQIAYRPNGEVGGVIQLVSTDATAAADTLDHLDKKLAAVGDVIVLQPAMMRGSGDVASSLDLRRLARRYRADLIVAFSIAADADTTEHLTFLTAPSLGMLPNVTADGHAIIRAAVIDTRTGVLVGDYSVRRHTVNITNVWRSDDVRNQTRDEAVDAAMKAGLDRLVDDWPTVLAREYRVCILPAHPELTATEFSGRPIPTPPGPRYRTRR